MYFEDISYPLLPFFAVSKPIIFFYFPRLSHFCFHVVDTLHNLVDLYKIESPQIREDMCSLAETDTIPLK